MVWSWLLDNVCAEENVQARKELNLADVEPEEDPQAKDRTVVFVYCFLFLQIARAIGGFIYFK